MGAPVEHKRLEIIKYKRFRINYHLFVKRLIAISLLEVNILLFLAIFYVFMNII